jgi:hypothetical protein
MYGWCRDDSAIFRRVSGVLLLIEFNVSATAIIMYARFAFHDTLVFVLVFVGSEDTDAAHWLASNAFRSVWRAGEILGFIIFSERINDELTVHVITTVHNNIVYTCVLRRNVSRGT